MRKTLLFLVSAITLGCVAAQAQDTTQDKAQGGDDKDWYEHPYTINDQNQVDFGTYNGYRRYSSSCHTCHGPDGLGSSYAPNLTESLKTLDYDQFLDTVVNGKQEVNAASQKVMPAFAEDPNVMLNIDDIYAYLKARSNDAVGRGRPDRIDKDEDPVWQERKG